ncbi:uncharacterized protein MELLADRAFT_109477 [Melampsora larici-populina 98AG31]|uniref:Uncharacterized protein n=1 Tax=Melampsora larici-populina (strain 98AG31 / pathotype 3-4-7) TaxID=747676 RepID=F4RWL6_MELLP|nr:uncharacterized protein MELLADRAFT_109477 [Melampsora larici-populina 98AG31]EGG03213.1 hypothetical protein MELLADRAFT_109477 [Melampsora larici-populina 98AG31]
MGRDGRRINTPNGYCLWNGQHLTPFTAGVPGRVAMCPKDAVISLWIDTPEGKVKQFGEILSIFKHTRRPSELEVVTGDYLHLKIFTEVPIEKGNPFKRLNLPETQGHLCYYRVRTSVMIDPAQFIAHCGYVKYKPGECDPQCLVETIGLITLNCE